MYKLLRTREIVTYSHNNALTLPLLLTDVHCRFVLHKISIQYELRLHIVTHIQDIQDYISTLIIPLNGFRASVGVSLTPHRLFTRHKGETSILFVFPYYYTEQLYNLLQTPPWNIHGEIFVM